MSDNDSILERYTGKRTPSDAGEQTPDDAAYESAAFAFGWLRGIRDQAIMLELRFKDGRVQAMGYAWLLDAEFDPSLGITLHFSDKTVRVTGRNLNAESRPSMRLFNGLARHRVPWIQEADEPTALTAAKNATVIDAIQVH